MEIIYPINNSDYIEIAITSASGYLSSVITSTSGILKEYTDEELITLSGYLVDFLSSRDTTLSGILTSNLTHIHTGVSGINVTTSGNYIIIDGSDLNYTLVGDGQQIHTTKSGLEWAITFSGKGMSIGWGYFTGHSGTLITHYLESQDHVTTITPGGDDNLSIEQIAAMGDIYVDRGVNTDVVYTTGSGSLGIGFSWVSAISGARGIYTAPDPPRLACAYCDDTEFIIPEVARAGSFKSNNFKFLDNTGIINPLPAPDIRWASYSGIYLMSGRYFAAGPRIRKQFRDYNNFNTYWDITTPTLINMISGVNVVGGKINSSWYSVFLTSTSGVMFLPFLRVRALNYNSPYTGKTAINLAQHDDSTQYQNGFISSHDIWNGCRLYKIANDYTDGYELTIEGTVNLSNDEVIVNQNQTISGNYAKLQQGDYLLLAPPLSTPNRYLGCVRLNSGGLIQPFDKDEWAYYWQSRYTLSGNKATTPGNTYLGYYVPPNATKTNFIGYIRSETNSAVAVMLYLYYGVSGTDVLRQYQLDDATSNQYKTSSWEVDFNLTSPCILRNSMQEYRSSAWQPATIGYIYINGWSE